MLDRISNIRIKMCSYLLDSHSWPLMMCLLLLLLPDKSESTLIKKVRVESKVGRHQDVQLSELDSHTWPPTVSPAAIAAAS